MIITIGAALFVYFLFCPIVIGKPDDYRPPLHKKLMVGDTIKPLKGFNISEIYIVFARTDVDDLPEITHKRILFSTKKEQIEQLSNLFVFKYSDGDLSTCESFIYAYNNGHLVFSSEMAIIRKDSIIGLQNRDYGWVVSNNSKEIIQLLKEFNTYRYPFLFP